MDASDSDQFYVAADFDGTDRYLQRECSMVRCDHFSHLGRADDFGLYKNHSQGLSSRAL